MAKEEDKDQLAKDWTSQIDLGKKFKERYAKPSDWEDYKSNYRGEFQDTDVPLNRIFSTGKSLTPRTYFKTPAITVTPRRPEFAFHARVVEAVDNWLINELYLKYQLKRAGNDSYLTGVGCLKLGYDSEYGYIPAQAVDQDGGTITQLGRKEAQHIEYREYVKPGMPWAIRTRPEEIIVPYGYDDPKGLPWICHQIIRPLRDVKDDIKYDRSKTRKLEGGYIPRVVDGVRPAMARDFLNLAEPYVLLQEVRDARTGRMYVFAEDMVILDVKDTLQIEGLPYEFIMFNEDPDFFWAIPDVKMLMPQQKELNDIKKMMAKLRRYNILKFLYKKGAMDQDTLNSLLSTDIDDIGCGLGLDIEALAQGVLPLQPHNLLSEHERDEQMVLSDMRETIGLSRNQVGEFIPMTSKTAEETRAVAQATEIRVDERRDIMADVLVNVIRKWNQFIFKFWDTKKVVEIVGEQGQKEWIEYTGDQLKGEYFLKIDPDSGVPVSKEIRYEQALRLLELFRNDPQIDQLALKKIVLQQFEWIDPTAALLSIEPTQNMSMPGEEGAPSPFSIPGMGPTPNPNARTPRVIPLEQKLRELKGGR